MNGLRSSGEGLCRRGGREARIASGGHRGPWLRNRGVALEFN